ncbi:ankyrin repeat domain-containing protein 2 isoform X2 [Pleurodeles waltl]|uniref:ankyrin repeat domain-containing protein 2 isoform X2 n=1 Tax=Pleurodeles waltl TaxID=8319 RepID=UPI003709931C
MEKEVKWATDLIDQKLELEEKTEKMKGRSRKTGLVNIENLDLEEEKYNHPLDRGIARLKAEERVRKTSLDLRREIVDVGGIENLMELRKQRKEKKKRRSRVSVVEPPPENEEIMGPVQSEEFLKAAVEGKIKIIEKFLEDDGSADTHDEFRRTALHRASLEGHVNILQKLLDSKATVNFRDRLDSTAMHWACRGGKLEVVKLLQNYGADINMKDKLLSTPLHVATRTGRVDIVEHLIATGVDINYKDREGKTPMDLVQQWQSDTRDALSTKMSSEIQA